jgi:ABC-2 type transport system ATP-binding protein
MNEMIRVHDLRKTFRVTRGGKGLTGAIKNLLFPDYKLVKAVDGVSFTLREGELVGYLGPNGAGKSTTLKILTGLLVPSSGEVQVNNRIPWKDRASYVAQIGAVFGQRTTLWWDLPLQDSFELLQPMYKIPEVRFRNNLRDFTDLLEMGPFLHTPVRSLSLGQRMRGDLAAALLHEPPLLFLDEPTIGLDVVAKERIRQFIQHVHTRRRTTIILTTHDISDIEKLCERVIIIDQGKLLYDGALQSLLDRFQGGLSLVVTFAEYVADASLPGLPPPQQDGLVATYHFDGKQVTAAGLIGQIFQRFRVADVEIRRPAIEETIRRIYEQKLLF